jgi:hypothetical protein
MPRLHLHDLDPEDLQPDNVVQGPDSPTDGDDPYLQKMINEAISEGPGSQYTSVPELMADLRKALATDTP